MPKKSCCNCKHCAVLKPMREGVNPLWLCYGFCDDEGVEIISPDAYVCDLWEATEHGKDD